VRLDWLERRCVAELDGSSGVKLHAQSIGFGGGMTEAEVADRAQALGQDVTEVTTRKLHTRQSQGAIFVLAGAIFPAEGNGVLIDLENAGVGDGGVGDVSPEVFEGAGPGTAGLDVHAPILAPDLRIDLPVVVFEQSIEVLAESGLEVRQMQQEPRFFDAHELVALVETGAGHQAMNVRMKLQFLGPGVQDGDEAVDVSAQSFISGQLFTQSAGSRGEEQVVGLVRPRTEETTAQFCWQSEGDEEVRRVDPF